MRVDLYNSGGYADGGISTNGGTVSGLLVLAGNPSQALEAVPKQYVDAYYNSLNANNFSAGTINAARLPALTGDLTSSAGSGTLTLTNTGVTAGSYAKVTVDNKGRVTADGGSIVDADIPFGLSWNKVTTGKPTTISGYGITDALIPAGGTLTGFLTLAGSPSLPTHAVPKSYVDTMTGGGGVSVGDIIRKAVSVTPSGFLKCNGAELDKTTYAALYAVIGDNYNSNTLPGSGKPWQQQYDFNTTQSTDITGWTTGTALPSAMYNGSTVVTKNRVYLLGGYNGTAWVSTVYTAPINADGTLGTWTTGTALPGVAGWSQAITTKNRVYLFSGFNGSTYDSTIYTAPINTDGTLGTWSTGPATPTVHTNAAIIVTKNKVYLFNGYNGSAWVNLAYAANINTDGTLSTWYVPNTSLPSTNIQTQGCSFVVKNIAYVITSSSIIYSATINSNGDIGNWSTSVGMPTNLSYTVAFVTKNRVYLISGHNGTTYVGSVYTAPINTDGTLGTWTIGTSLPGATSGAYGFITKNRIYMCGGASAGSTYISTVYTAPISGGFNDYSAYYAADPNNYLMGGSGQPWNQQYQINAIQNGNITGWVDGTSFPISVRLHACFTTKNRAYVIGGVTTGSAFNSVYTAPINTDGTLGTWVASANLPAAYWQPVVVVTKNRVYSIGGYSGSASINNVYYAPINSDGTIGTWVTDTSLPTNIGYAKGLITKNRVYLLGGYNSSASIYTAPIDSNGVIGTWVSAGTLVTGVHYSTLIVTTNRVYLVGGYSGGVAISTVQTATINSDGILGTWSTVTNFPVTIAEASSCVVKNTAYIIGGWGASQSNVVYYAPINSDGTLGTWVTGSTLTGYISTTCEPIVTNSKIFIIAGQVSSTVSSNVQYANFSGGINDYSPYYDGTLNVFVSPTNYLMPGSGRPWQQQYQVNETQTADITGWTGDTALPAVLQNSQAVVTKNRVYLLGGNNGSSNIATVYTAPLNGDGTVGTWTTGTALPGAMGYSQAIVTKNRVYLIGGIDGGGSYTAAIYTAPINSDGTLGTWAIGTSLPSAYGISQAVVTKNRVYLIGGNTSELFVYTAPINADGTLGGWNTGVSLPGALSRSSIIVTKNRVYLCGGYNNSSQWVSTVYSTTINNDGTMGTWLTDTSLPAPLAFSSAFVTKNKAYLIGGRDNASAAISTVYTALINSDGTLGTWTTGTALPAPLGYSTIFITNTKLYLCGGVNSGNTTVSTVYKATILEGLNDYSPYYNGTITPTPYTDTSSTKFLLPNLTSDEYVGSYSYIKY